MFPTFPNLPQPYPHLGLSPENLPHPHLSMGCGGGGGEWVPTSRLPPPWEFRRSGNGGAA